MPAVKLAVMLNGEPCAMSRKVVPSKNSTISIVLPATEVSTVIVTGPEALRTVLLVGLVIAMDGTAAAVTFTVIAPEVVLRPLAAVAFAVSVWAPSFKVGFTLKGEVESTPSEVAPSKNSTEEIVEPVTAASAEIVTEAGAVKEALLAGLEMETVGGSAAAPWTTIVPVMKEE